MPWLTFQITSRRPYFKKPTGQLLTHLCTEKHFHFGYVTLLTLLGLEATERQPAGQAILEDFLAQIMGSGEDLPYVGSNFWWQPR